LPSISIPAYTPSVTNQSRRTSAFDKQVTFRMPTALWQRLQAAAATLDQSQAQIITEALESYLSGLPAKDRQLIESLLARRQKS
jgi:predicted DNA-binding protein